MSSSSSDQSKPPVNSSFKLFYKGECLKPDPLRPYWNTFTALPRTRVPVKAPRPSMRCMLTLTIPKWLEDIIRKSTYFPLPRLSITQSGTAGFYTTGTLGMGMQRLPMLSWAAMYDYFFQSIWEDVLREKGFQLEFRPVRPVLYLQNTFPVFGLLICEGAVITEYGYIRNNQFCSRTTGSPLYPLFDMTKPFDVLALRMMIVNVHSYAQKISEGEATDTKVRHIPYRSPGYNHDASRSEREVGAQWMVSRRIRLNGPDCQSDDLYKGLSDTLKSWLLLFVCCDIPAVLDNDLVSNCAQCLTPRQKLALDQLKREIPQVYDALHTVRLVAFSSNSDRAALFQDAQGATSFFAGIQDTFGTKDEKPCPIRLSILLNSFLTAAWTDIRAKGPSDIHFQCYPSWSMHRKGHTEDVDPMPHHEMVPDAALSSSLTVSSAALLSPGTPMKTDSNIPMSSR
ncbi:hypothetical protein ARMGADRAFT_1069433 [Armillaria gallica]|uniref:Uncharacterized protein n=1 Tax=Armillaria gallica TaxID=47427 RepID=A0A2H3CJU9_ARMGA|nr:hypothetical protein ARMGADRAFT_1069433 [Armillaria gallica]